MEIEGEGMKVVVPHARGPDVVGVEDMGLQDGKGIEVQIGKESSPKPEQEELMEGIELNLSDDPPKPEDEQDREEDGEEEEEEDLPANGDGDIVLTDADGKPEDSDFKADGRGRNGGPDSVDTSSV